MRDLTKFEMESIKEVIAIGAGHASKALSDMTKKKIGITFPSVGLCPLEKITDLIGNPEELVATVYLKMDGKIDGKESPVGSMLFIFPHESAIEFSSLLQGEESWEGKRELTEMDISALSETGNILSGASLAAMGRVLEIEIIESLPHFAYDMLQATLNVILAGLASRVRRVLVFKTTFEVEKHKIRAYFFLMLEPDSFELLIENIHRIFYEMLKEYVEEEYKDTYT